MQFELFICLYLVASARSYSDKKSAVVESEGDEYSNALETILRSKDIDGYEIRRIMNEVAVSL